MLFFINGDSSIITDYIKTFFAISSCKTVELTVYPIVIQGMVCWLVIEVGN